MSASRVTMQIGIASTYFARHRGEIPAVDHRFAAAAEARGAEVVFVDPTACTFEITSGRTAIRLDGRPLALDGLFIRRAAWFWTAMKTLVLLAHEGGTVCVDRPATFLGTFSGKFQAQLRRYRMPQVGTPRSFLYFSESALAADPPPRDVYPLLRKPLRGSLGEGIVRVADPDALAALTAGYDFRDPLMLQQVVVGTEYRALMLRSHCLGVVEKRPGPNGLGNFAKGAEFVPAPPEAARDVEALGRTVMGHAPYDFAALDAMRAPDGRLWVLECNRNPQFHGFEKAFPGVDVADAVMGFVVERVQAAAAARARVRPRGPSSKDRVGADRY